jgi:hypothetical protein
MARHWHEDRTITWTRVNPQRWQTEQEVDGVPVFIATRARGTWRLRHHRSTRVVGGFRTIEEVRAYAPRLLAEAA